jgi:hypothetical protein
MDISSWTPRQKIKASIPVVVAVVLALQNAACSPAPKDYTVRNDTREPLLYADFYSGCDQIDVAFTADESWYVIAPGEVQNSTAYGTTGCLVISDVARVRFARADFRRDALYVVRTQNGSPAVEAIGGSSGEKRNAFTILSVAAGGVFLIGMVVAAFIALRFFYRYYLRGNKAARIE